MWINLVFAIFLTLKFINMTLIIYVTLCYNPSAEYPHFPSYIFIPSLPYSWFIILIKLEECSWSIKFALNEKNCKIEFEEICDAQVSTLDFSYLFLLLILPQTMARAHNAQNVTSLSTEHKIH